MCSGLTSVTIPTSVTSIGGYAFVNCTGLTSVTIPNSVTSIGGYAFENCSGLTSVTIPNSVTSIGEGAFQECSSLTSVTIPNSVTSIGIYAFQYCSGLTFVSIGNSVTSIGNDTFNGCSSLTSVTIGNSVTSIGDYAFYQCSGLTSVTIPNSVTSIGNDTFNGCSGLTSITIGNSVTSIGDNAFNGCWGITSVKVVVSDLSTFCNNQVKGLINTNIGKPITLVDNGGKEGEVLSIRVKAAKGLAFGEYLLTLNNVILSDADGNTVKPDGWSFKIRVVTSHAEEGLLIENAVIRVGEAKDVSLSIVLEWEKYTGFQFDVKLPNGLLLEAGNDGSVYALSANQSNSPVCDVESLGGGVYRFVVYSDASKPFKNGEVMSLHIRAKSGIELKRYSLQLSQVMLSDADGLVKKIGNRQSTIKVRGLVPEPGDLNDDGEVDVTDVVELIDLVLSGSTDPAADINGDGEVDVTDVAELIDMVLSGE